MTQIYRVLGLDPGKPNHGYGIVMVRQHAQRKGWEFKIKRTGLLGVNARGEPDNSILDDYAQYPVQIPAYVRSIRKLLRDEKIDIVCIERLILRRFIPKGITVECINAMIALAATEAIRMGIPVYYLSAVVWKNEANRHFDLDKSYERLLALPHEMDSVLIGLYGAKQHLDPGTRQLDWMGIKDIVERTHAASTLPLKKPKKLANAKAVSRTKANSSVKDGSGLRPKRKT